MPRGKQFTSEKESTVQKGSNEQDEDINIRDIDSVTDGAEDSEQESLVRLSQQTQDRRQRSRESFRDPSLSSDVENNEDTDALMEEPILVAEEDDGDEDGDGDDDEEDEDDEGDDSEDHDNEEDDEGDDDFDMEPADFLRRLLQPRSRPRQTNVDVDHPDEVDEEHHDDDDLDPDDPRAEFLRAIGALSGGRGSDGENQPAGFADVMQRLIGSGMMFGGRGSGGQSSEIDALLNNLNQRTDTYIILESLNELSERLLMMNGITAERLIPANRLARSLVNILNDPTLEEELELTLVACRCLYNLVEVNLDFIHDALNNDAVPTLCNKLLEIKYIDLTEQALQALEMISRDPISHNSIISNNGLMACLQYLDFLTIHAQRKCLTIVSNSCSNISVSNFPMVRDALGSISEVVRNHNDQIVVEKAWLTISRIIVCFRNKPEYLNELFADKNLLLKELTQIISISCNKASNNNTNDNRVVLNYSSCLSLISSLTILASVSIDVSRILIAECNIGGIVVKSLNKYAKSKSEESTSTSSEVSISMEALMAAPKELTSTFLTMLGYLLPINYTSSDALYLRDNFEEYDERKKLNETRLELCESIIPNEYRQFVSDIWTMLIISFEATMDFEIRRKSFINLYRIINSVVDNDFSFLEKFDAIARLLASVVNQCKPTIHKEFAHQNRETGYIHDVEMATSDNEGEHCEDADDEIRSEEDDHDHDDSEDEHEDMPRRIRESHRVPENANRNSNTLLLSAFRIIKVLLEKAPSIVINPFEREGLVKDVDVILVDLTGNVEIHEIRQGTPVHSIAGAYSSKYIDTEFTKEYESRLTNEKLYSRILQIGTEIDNLYKSEKFNEDGANITEQMQILENIKITLSDQRIRKLFSFEDWIGLWDTFKITLNGGTEVGQISSFELISSGLIEVLSNILSCEGDNGGSIDVSNCYRAFISSFFIRDEHKNSGKLLVSKLQEALTRSESFDIVSAGTATNPSLGYNYLRADQNQASIMANQIKLKLSPAERAGTATNGIEDDKIASLMQSMILSVHAIATFKSVFTFLKQRFRLLDELSANGANNDDELDEDGNKKSKMNIEFLINGEVVPTETTIYGAIYRSLQSKPDQIIDPSKIWSVVHNITYRRVSSEVQKESAISSYNFSYDEKELEIYDKPTISILKLLRILYEMNSFVKNNIAEADIVPTKDFTNWKLSVKLNRQLEEPLVVASGTLPGWSIHVTKQFPFIFPLETRIFFLQSTSFGYSRLINQWQIRTNQGNEETNNNNPSGQGTQLGRPTRHKVRISRKMMLQSALKVLGMYGSTPGILEIEYFDEVGSGLGPTLEFYSTVSKEFSKKKLRLWRNQDSNNDDPESYVVCKHGLFPLAMDKNAIGTENGKKVLFFFSSLGKFIARALLDSRIIDFNFNPVFLKLVQLFNQYANKSSAKLLRKMSTVANLRIVDPEWADSIDHLYKYVNQFKTVPIEERDSIMVDGATIKDLAIYFELPGNPDYELITNGNEIQVTAQNLEMYINKVLEAVLYTGIIHQTKAFMDGFSKVFPINALIIFSPQELVELFGNAEEDWSYDTLASAIIANHGYTKESDAIKSLIEILIEFNGDQKRAFLQFLTGAPKLPIGGFKALTPELTVVRKNAEDGLKDDDYLPSVMTCANYLKLPNYSSKDMMREKLMQAISEGAEAFLLS
ncbi:UFD4 [[Candida] subhashii]|uniref:UFD4 n=1 Tax=[Candida] subhashii TaxID=561895 RepID=A0A8J5UKT6_9ASCO|nr:UFD4 [[Candida] subhashii]KAG7662237.1 UFD4 [[Candida] subhashii]